MAQEHGARDAEVEGGVIDWTGKPFSCQDCPHQPMREQGRCVLGRICVRDQRAKRIDRFFAANAQFVGDYIDHPYFEIRTIAAKHANIFLLPRLMRDKDPEVRAMVAMRLPVSRVREMMDDADRKVRIACAMRL